jgi:hypothetical protein
MSVITVSIFFINIAAATSCVQYYSFENASTTPDGVQNGDWYLEVQPNSGKRSLVSQTNPGGIKTFSMNVFGSKEISFWYYFNKSGKDDKAGRLLFRFDSNSYFIEPRGGWERFFAVISGEINHTLTWMFFPGSNRNAICMIDNLCIRNRSCTQECPNGLEGNNIPAMKNIIARSLRIIIDEPQTKNVTSVVAVKGHLSSNLIENENLWIAVKPNKSIADWWPQDNNGPIKPNSRNEFEGNAFLGGDNGDGFEIGVLIVNDSINKRFMEWVDTSKRESNWIAITEDRPGTDLKVIKEDIEASKFAKIDVILIK